MSPTYYLSFHSHWFCQDLGSCLPFLLLCLVFSLTHRQAIKSWLISYCQFLTNWPLCSFRRLQLTHRPHLRRYFVWPASSGGVSGLEGVLFCPRSHSQLNFQFSSLVQRSSRERANQDLEAALRWATATNPLTWCTHLVWVEYAQLPAPTQASFHLKQVQVISHPCFLSEEAALLRTSEANKRLAGCQQNPAKVWLSSRNIPRNTESRKLSPHYTAPFVIDKIISSSAVKLKVPENMRIHPVFHASQVKSASSSPLCYFRSLVKCNI